MDKKIPGKKEHDSNFHGSLGPFFVPGKKFIIESIFRNIPML
jgi:hypothetical protein